jgi:hypothetical protein
MSRAEETNDDKARFLTDTEIWGDARNGNGQLQVMKDYGPKTGISDLAVLLGSEISKSNATTRDGQRTGPVWSASSDGGGCVRGVHGGGGRDDCYPCWRVLGARPALPSSLASSIRLSETKPSRKISGVDVVEYGEYPQTIADKNTLKGLEQAFSRNQLQKTGKKYTLDAEKYDAYNKPFKAKEHAEYQHKGKKYIRVEAKPYGYGYDKGYSMLSNGEQAQAGQSYWVEVQPIEWLRDPSGICVARQALFAGVQFDKKSLYYGKFENTDIYMYLNDIFMKEIRPSKKELGATPATAQTKEPDAPAGESHLSKHEALANRLSKTLDAEIVFEPRFRVNEATEAGLRAVLSVMRKSGEIKPVDEVSAFQKDNKGNSYLSLPMAEKIEAAFVAEPEKMQEAFKEAYEQAQSTGWRR